MTKQAAHNSVTADSTWDVYTPLWLQSFLNRVKREKRKGGVVDWEGAAERSIHLFAAGSVVSASPLPAYLLARKLFVVVPLDSDAHHSGLVHNLLDDFTVFANDFA